MKILVIGREGQLARALFEAALLEEVALVLAARPELDLRDDASVLQAIERHRPDVVVNTAAYTQVDKAESDEAEARAVNAAGAGHVARACEASGIPIIHVSTDYVFDGHSDRPYREDDPAAPINVYGRTKREGECNVSSLCERHLIVRTSWLHSPWGSNFVLTMLRLAAMRPTLNVVDDQFGCPTYAPHLAQVLLVMARRAVRDPDDLLWGTYHAAGLGGTTWCEFARDIFINTATHGLPAASVLPIAATDYPTQALRPRNSTLDCSKLRSVFAVELPSWQSGVATCVARVASNLSPLGQQSEESSVQ